MAVVLDIEVIFPPRRQLALSGDIFVCHNERGKVVTGR
jgi:hypothetical protein